MLEQLRRLRTNRLEVTIKETAPIDRFVRSAKRGKVLFSLDLIDRKQTA